MSDTDRTTIRPPAGSNDASIALSVLRSTILDPESSISQHDHRAPRRPDTASAVPSGDTATSRTSVNPDATTVTAPSGIDIRTIEVGVSERSKVLDSPAAAPDAARKTTSSDGAVTG